MRPAGETIGVADCAFPATFTLADILLRHFGRESRRGWEPRAWRATEHAHPVAGQGTGDSGQASMQWPCAG